MLSNDQGRWQALRVGLTLGVIGSALIGCAPLSSSSSPVASPTGVVEPGSTPSNGPQSTASAAPTSSQDHVATGLALAASVDPSSSQTEIFVVEPNGELRQVTGLRGGPSVGGAGPSWSPDGRRIAHHPSALGSASFPAVLVVNANGRRPRLIHSLDAEEFSPIHWSADSTQLLYSDATPPGDRRIWLTDLATGVPDQVATGARPSWLPDGQRIAFVDGVSGLVAGDPQALTQVVFVMNLAGGKPRQFAQADYAYWSPNGDAVLIEANGVLTLTSPDGSGGQDLAAGAQPAWSPDGSHIAFLSGVDADGRSLVAVMDRSGQIVWDGAPGSGVAWSPDGTRLAVEISYPERVVQVLDAATGAVLWETSGSMPDWRP